MRRRLLALALGLALALPAGAGAACRQEQLVSGPDAGLLAGPPSAGWVTIQWFGHSFFQLTSPSGTRVITDPFGPMDYPLPEVWPHAVTVGREHGNHNNVGLARGNPVVLRGLRDEGGDWNQVQTAVRDVFIYNIPIYQRAYARALKGAAFVFEMGDLCVVHLGDLASPLSDSQRKRIGRADVVLIPIGGTFTMGPEEAREVLGQLQPKVAIPMHFWEQEHTLQEFIRGLPRVRRLEGDTLRVSRESLPRETEVVVLRHAGWLR